MRVHWSIDDEATYGLTVRFDHGESVYGVGQGGRSVSMVTDACRFVLPVASNPHPDSLALAALTVVAPWLSSSIEFDQPISTKLSGAITRHFGIHAGPVDNSLEARSGSRVGLAYSGGADSIATGELLPPDTPLIHFRRVRHPRVPNRATHFRADVQAALVNSAADRGRQVHTVESDLEFMVGPFPMFPEWVTVATPAVLLADELDLGGIGFGTIMGSRYLSNGYRYRLPPDNDRWAEVFDAAGLPFVRPACGLTEVSTIRIAASSPLASLSRSCALGTIDGPCMNCKKCLRKELTQAGLERRPLSPELLSNMTPDHPAVLELLEPPPYYFQHVLEYGLARAEELDATFLSSVKSALGHPTIESTEWTTRYYEPAISNDVPLRWRSAVSEAVRRETELMSAEDVRTVESWDAAERARLSGDRSLGDQ